MTCPLCGRRPHFAPSKICDPCRDSLDAELLCTKIKVRARLLPETAYPLSVHWRYRGAVRDGILAFKVRQEWSAGICLLEAFMEGIDFLDLCHWADGIMPAPSSLWSRLRGRYDLAALLAWNLAQKSELPLWRPPRALWGSWRKQAQQLRGKRQGRKYESAATKWGPAYFQGQAASVPRILIVDDVVTSGQTLRNFAAHFEGIQIRFLCLANAGKTIFRDD